MLVHFHAVLRVDGPDGPGGPTPGEIAVAVIATNRPDGSPWPADHA